ncbi:MAG: tRNA (adenosine(37)-N6)-dimethylallyltransferase MiaA [Halofilum sp. (in: g-proteobacteria)]|nr:tRNA (adenosine(37)-N6)-dimethylallyltransferase MiaA [Halofilum sp. (in: g-proteobacteria)]
MSAEPGTPPAVFLLGPTAAGKTGAAVALATTLPLEIVSVDSALVYRGLDIGAARPDPATLRRAPHRLLDRADPTQPYSAGRFRDEALAAMAEIRRASRVPLLAGGTMMYFHALEHGLAALPSADPALRAELEREAERRGLAALHAELATADPAAAARIHPNDPQRIQRALEVVRLTGRPISELQQSGEPLPYRVLRLALAPAERATLHARIEQRFDAMLAHGLVEEVRALRARPGMHAELPSMRAVGYRQVWQYLEGELSWDEMRERGIVATRQLARRQLTWLRRMEGVEWFDSEDPRLHQRLRARVERFLGEQGRTGTANERE